MGILQIILLIIVLSLNVASSMYIGKAPAYELSQKKLQIAIIWFVPIMGAAFCSYFLWWDRKKHVHKNEIGNITAFSNTDAIGHYFGANHRGGR